MVGEFCPAAFVGEVGDDGLVVVAEAHVVVVGVAPVAVAEADGGAVDGVVAGVAPAFDFFAIAAAAGFAVGSAPGDEDGFFAHAFGDLAGGDEALVVGGESLVDLGVVFDALGDGGGAVCE